MSPAVSGALGTVFLIAPSVFRSRSPSAGGGVRVSPKTTLFPLGQVLPPPPADNLTSNCTEHSAI